MVSIRTSAQYQPPTPRFILAQPGLAGLMENLGLSATLAWLDAEPLQPGRLYWALHQHRWVKSKVTRVLHRLDIHTLEQQSADRLEANGIGRVELQLQAPLPAHAYAQSRALGALILVDSASHRTAAAVLLD